MILDDEPNTGRRRGSDRPDDADGDDPVDDGWDDSDDALVVNGDRFARLRDAGLPIRPDRPPATPSQAVTRLLADDVERVELSGGAMALLRDPIAASTEYGYHNDWAYFDRWCHTRGYGNAADANEVVVLEFIAYQVEHGLSMSTIRGRLAAIAHAFRIQAKRSPTSSDIVVRATRNAARRVLEHRRQAAPLRLAEMRDLVRRLQLLRPNHPAMRRDQLLVALGWAGALRASELVGLDVADLTFIGDANTGDGGVLLRIRTSKTDQTGHVDYVAVPYATHFSVCPARMAQRWCAARRTGPMFRAIDRHGRPGQRLGADAITRNVVRPLIGELLRVDGLPMDPEPYSSHSLRAGFVTEARAMEVPDARIARHTRHTVPGHRHGGILDVYDRPHTLFEKPALDPAWW